MAVRAGIVDFPFALFVNSNRRTSYDYFVGPYAYYWNDIIKFIKVNLTIVVKKDYGTCFSNGKCNGIPGLLHENQIDFSFTTIDPNFGPDVPISSETPFLLGPTSGVVAITVQSLPIVKTKVTKLDALQVYREMSPAAHLLCVLFLIFVFALINFPLPRVNRRLQMKVKNWQMDFFSIIDVVFNGRYVALPILLYYVFTFTSLLMFISLMKMIICGSTNSDVTKIEPPKYYGRIEEFITAAEGQKFDIYVLKYLRVQSEFLKRPEPIYRRISKIAKKLSRAKVVRLVHFMATKSDVLLDTELSASFIQSLFCAFRKDLAFDLKLMDPPMTESLLFLGLNSNISISLKHLLVKTYTILFESGLAREFDRHSYRHVTASMLGNSRLLINCYSALSRRQWTTDKLQSTSKMFTMDKASIIFKILLLVYPLSLVFYYFERTRDSIHLTTSSLGVRRRTILVNAFICHHRIAISR